MKNREVWDTYDFYTSEVTKHARYLGFAGVAICWFFRSPDVTFPGLILLSLIVFVAFFLADVTQYYVAAIRLRHWMQSEEAKCVEDSLERDYWPPKSLDTPAFLFFHLKLLFLFIGYLLIGSEIVSRIS